MAKEVLGSQGGEGGKQPTLFYSTNEDIATTFSERKKRKEEKAAWKIHEKELEADRIKSEESKEELEFEMILRNSDDGLRQLIQELRSLKSEFFSVVPDHAKGVIGEREESIEVYSKRGTLIKKFVGLKGTSHKKPTSVMKEYRERFDEHLSEWKLLLDKIKRLGKRIEEIKQIQKGELTASEIAETLYLTKE